MPRGIEGLEMYRRFSSGWVAGTLDSIIAITNRNSDLPMLAHPSRRTDEGLPELKAFGPEDPGYAGQMRRAFDFIRMNADRRYSDRTLMGMIRAADRVDGGSPMAAEPLLLTISVPFTFDEETEVKQGGTMGMAVVMPSSDEATKTCIAIAGPCRRQKYGTLLVRTVVDNIARDTSFWTGNHATAALLFGLNVGLIPSSMSPNGSVEMQLAEVATGGAVPMYDEPAPALAF